MITNKRVLTCGDFVRSNTGSTPIIIVCIIVFVVISAALITDVGYAAIERYKLANGAELLARAGLEEMARNRADTESFIKNYAVNRMNDLNSIKINISHDNREITVHLQKPFSYIFLKIFGYKDKHLTAAVTAGLSAVSSYKGVKPLAVVKESIVFDKPVVLLEAASKASTRSNFIPLELSKGTYEADMLFGYGKSLEAGDKVSGVGKGVAKQTRDSLAKLIKKCDHVPPCTYNQYVKDCTRIITIPVVDHLEPLGKTDMVIVGFASFFAEDTGIKDGRCFIKGRFIRHIANENTSDSIEDFGLKGIKFLKSY